MTPTSPNDVDKALARTPYLVADGEDALKRFQRVSLGTQVLLAKSRAAYQRIEEEAHDRLGNLTTVIRSELVAESNKMEGYDSAPGAIRNLISVNKELMDREVGSFIAHIRDDPNLMENLGLYRAYSFADEWARGHKRPSQTEIRSLHQLIVPSLDNAGAYKNSPNEIGGSGHSPTDPWDVQKEMSDLAEWFSVSTGDAVLDASVVHAWLTHIHPFDDGNGRLARLLANFALVQHSYPPLLLRSGADREIYLDALAASDNGDLLPLYDLFFKSLRRRLKELERPDYVERKIRSELFRSVETRFSLWRDAVDNFTHSFRIKANREGLDVRIYGTPSLEDFVALEDLSSAGNQWYLKLRERSSGADHWLLWFGYRSQDLRDLLGQDSQDRGWPSIFFSRPSNDPTSIHPWEPVFEGGSSRRPDEISVVPAAQSGYLFRYGFETREMDVTEASKELVRAITAGS